LQGGILSAETILSSTIEAAVGIGGFAGIIAAIRQRGVNHWPSEQRILLMMLLTASAATVLFSLAPLLLNEVGVPQSISWRLCSGALLLWMAGISVHRNRQFQSFTHPVAFPKMMYVWMIVLVVLQAINIFLGESWPFILGVVGILGNGFIFFLLLLFWEDREVDKAA
jgi:hypothetical protein